MNQFELGKMLYLDWKDCNTEAHEKIREIGKESVNIKELKNGFIEERSKHIVSDDGESEECFYGAMDEVGVDYWVK